MYSEKSNTFVRQKPSWMNAAVTQEALVIPAPSLEGIYPAADWLFLVSDMHHFMKLHFSVGGKTNKVRYLEGQNSLKRKQGQTHKCQMLLLLFPAETNYCSPKLSFSSRGFVHGHLTSASDNVFPRKCVPQERWATECGKAHLLNKTPPCAGPQAPGDPGVRESYWPPSYWPWLEASPRWQTQSWKASKALQCVGLHTLPSHMVGLHSEWQCIHM